VNSKGKVEMVLKKKSGEEKKRIEIYELKGNGV
jgi:hypothetical protein